MPDRDWRLARVVGAVERKDSEDEKAQGRPFPVPPAITALA
jgi:hypothetical protein